MILALALRNLFRHLRRSLLTIAGIALGSALTLFSVGIGDGGHAQMIENGVVLGQGHAAVQREGYQLSREMALTVPSPEALAGELRRDPLVRDVFVRLRGEGMLATARGAEGVVFTAIDPSLPGEARLLRTGVKEGSFLESAEAPEVVLGEKLARRLAVKPGNKAVLTVQDAGGEITGVLLKVKGVFRSGSPGIDGSYVLLPLGMAQRALRVGDAAHSLAVYLVNPRSQGEFLARWNTRLPAGTELLPWQEMQPDLRDYVVLDDLLAYPIYLIILFLVTVGVLNTVLMSVMERQHEIGVLLALGMRRGGILLMVLAETAAIGALGLALGIGLGLAVNAYFHVHGIDLRSFSGNMEWELAGTVVDPVLYSNMRPERITQLVAVVFSLTLLMGLYPAWKAARLDPVQAIQKV